MNMQLCLRLFSETYSDFCVLGTEVKSPNLEKQNFVSKYKMLSKYITTARHEGVQWVGLSPQWIVTSAICIISCRSLEHLLLKNTITSQ
jgi:hypothetical protein